jgi:HEAT repeat protein
MPSRVPVAPLLGALIHVVRQAPEADTLRAALELLLLRALDGEEVRISAGPDRLAFNAESVSASLPGATLICEQFLLHGIAACALPADLTTAELGALVRMLAGGPGDPFDTLAALGVDPARFDLRPAEPLVIQRFAAEAIRIPDGPDAQPALPERGREPEPRLTLGEILQLGRRAIEREDWEALLDAGLALMDLEDEAPSDRTARTFRLELQRLIPRDQVGRMARLAQGERGQEAIGLLRRLGPAATETLVELLIASPHRGERRGYYDALTRMGEGTRAILDRLEHPLWYVVRNAAELCGEMGLSQGAPALGRQASHPDERVRKAVAGALARLGSPVALEHLARLLADPEAGVRRQALLYLAGPRAAALCPAIATLLQRERDEDVVREALLALGRIGTPDAIALLDGWAGARRASGRPLRLRMFAVRGLVLAGPAALDSLSTLTRDEAAEVRAAAQGALAALAP